MVARIASIAESLMIATSSICKKVGIILVKTARWGLLAFKYIAIKIAKNIFVPNQKTWNEASSWSLSCFLPFKSLFLLLDSYRISPISMSVFSERFWTHFPDPCVSFAKENKISSNKVHIYLPIKSKDLNPFMTNVRLSLFQNLPRVIVRRKMTA